MAERVTVECRQCGEPATWTLLAFFPMIRQAENTRINLEDSGALNLSWYICDDCLGDHDEEWGPDSAQQRLERGPA